MRKRGGGREAHDGCVSKVSTAGQVSGEVAVFFSSVSIPLHHTSVVVDWNRIVGTNIDSQPVCSVN